MLIIHDSIQLFSFWACNSYGRGPYKKSERLCCTKYMFFISGVRKKTSPDIIFGGQKATRQAATFLDKHVGKLWELFISEH